MFAKNSLSEPTLTFASEIHYYIAHKNNDCPSKNMLLTKKRCLTPQTKGYCSLIYSYTIQKQNQTMKKYKLGEFFTNEKNFPIRNKTLSVTNSENYFHLLLYQFF